MSITVRQISDQDAARWDDYARRSPQSSPCHLWAWRRAIVDTYGHRSAYLCAEQDGEVKGILPLIEITTPFMGRYLASCPFTSYGGVCADSREAALALMAAARDLAVERNAKYIEIKNIQGAEAPDTEWQIKRSYCTMQLDLQPGSEAIWDGWKAKNRTNVRRAIKGGVTVEAGTHLIGEFYDLAARNMRLLGTPVHSQRFYERILDYFAPDSILYVGRVDGRAITANLGMSIDDRLEVLASVALPEFRNLKPSALVYWKIIEDACARGLKVLDLGRSAYDSGTYNFKAQLGCEPVPLEYTYYLNRLPSVPDINPDNPRYRLAIKAWQSLPLSVTKWVGPRLIRYIA